MSNDFKPQETTLGSFQETERFVFDMFQKRGFDVDASEAIAHTFTKVMLGYVTREGAIYSLTSAGVRNDTAVEIADDFVQLRDGLPEPEEVSQLKAGRVAAATSVSV